MPDLHFDLLYEQHSRLVYNLCLSYLQHAQEAEEATQDVFVKIHQRLHSFEGKSSVKTWVYRITVNHCLDLLRQRKRRAWISGWFGLKSDRDLEMPHFDHPGVQLEDREALEQLFSKINTLPENQRTALILRYLDDLPPPEIAEVMGLSLKAVESLLQRAKQLLKKKLSPGEGNDAD
jgi:RNA polymerase sigma factor (sigma-70 family)